MESYSYFIEDDHHIVEYSYDDIVFAVRSGSINKDKIILVIDNLTQDKRYIKAKEVLL